MELYDFPTGKYVRENNLKIQVIFESSLSEIKSQNADGAIKAPIRD